MESSGLGQIIRRIVREHTRPAVREARVSSEPDARGYVTVTVRSLTGDVQRLGPVPGAPPNAQRGDRVAVAVDEGEAVWVVASLRQPEGTDVSAELAALDAAVAAQAAALEAQEAAAAAALAAHAATAPAHGGDLAGTPRPPTAHDHDSRYYTESETDTLLAAKQNAATAATDAELTTHAALSGKGGHVPAGGLPAADLAFDPATQAELDTHKTSSDHDGRYYTEAEVDAAVVAAKARANHTGTQLAATVSDFVTTVRAQRLDQMAAPAAVIDTNGQFIRGMPTNPTEVGHAVAKGYLDTRLTALRLDQLAVPTGTVSMNSQALTNLRAPVFASEPLRRGDVQVKRDVAVPAVSANLTTDVVMTFPTAFADVNYGVSAVVRCAASYTGTQPPRVLGIVGNKAAGSVTIRVQAGSANLVAGDAFLDVTAIHD